MRVALPLAVALSALLAAPTAGAKGSAPKRVCGATGCARVADYPHVIVSLYPAAKRPDPGPRPFYRVHYAAPGVPPHTFVPSTGLVGTTVSDRRWYALDEPALSAIREATRGLEPYPASATWAVEVNSPGESSGRSVLAGSLLAAGAAGALLARRKSLG